MKISEITAENIADYLRIDEPGEIEIREIKSMMAGAKAYITGYTGLSIDELDQFDDITVALMILVSDYYENRTLYLDYKYKEENSTVKKILSLHCINFL